jgi:hypothetical protein
VIGGLVRTWRPDSLEALRATCSGGRCAVGRGTQLVPLRLKRGACYDTSRIVMLERVGRRCDCSTGQDRPPRDQVTRLTPRPFQRQSRLSQTLSCYSIRGSMRDCVHGAD